MTSPVVSYLHDQSSSNGLTVTNGIGRRTGMADQAGVEAWSYDKMGRPLTDQRTTNGVTKATSYAYNLDGSEATITYPSGRTITYAYNSAAQQISAKDMANNINYATSALYNPTGALSSLLNGTNLTSTLFYNNRLQLCRISVTTGSGFPANCADSTGTNIGNILDFTYGFNLGSSDNGNTAQITNNRDNTRTLTFSYDTINRIVSAHTNATTGTNCWGETFAYDAWANLLSIGGLGGYTGCTQENLPNVNPTSKNQMGFYSYDAAGNATNVVSGASYDAENRLSGAAGVNYIYDGDGRRVQKSSGKLYWYGVGSDPLDETDLTGSISNSSFSEYVFFAGKRVARRDSSGTIFYYFADYLGTARAMVQAGQTVACYESDFYPFGGQRTPVVNNCPQNYKFTGKERDSETNLDYFGARYYGSPLGRFSSVDKGAFQTQDPQSLNRYSYVRNNPLKYIDPTGNYFVVNQGDREAVQQWISTMLRTDRGRALVLSIANDSQPTFVSWGKLAPPSLTSKGECCNITAGATNILVAPPLFGVAGTTVTLDLGNIAFAATKSQASVFFTALKAFAHELTHVYDINSHSGTLQGAAAANAAGDAKSHEGASDTAGGTAEANAVAILTALGPDALNFIPNQQTDAEANNIVDKGLGQFWADTLFGSSPLPLTPPAPPPAPQCAAPNSLVCF